MCNAGRSTSRGQGSKGQAGAPRAAPRPSGQAGMSCFFFSQHPLDVFSTSRVHACGQFATQTLKKCPGGNRAPLPKDLAVPAVLWARRGRGSSWMTRSIAAQRGQNFLTAVINNSSTHLCEIQFSFLHLHHSTEDSISVTQIRHVSQGGDEGKKGVLSLRSGSRKKGRKKAMCTIHLQKEISGFTKQRQPSSGCRSEPPRAGSGLITGSTTGQRSFAPSQPLT